MRSRDSYIHTESKDGKLSCHLSVNTTLRLIKYCSMTNTNKTAFVEQCVKEKLTALEREQYKQKTKEELLRLVTKEELINIILEKTDVNLED